MKKIPLAVCALLLVAATLGADEAQEKPTREQTMAERAAAARTKRNKGGTRVITNADVEKSRGKLIETSGAQEPIEPAPTETTTERHEAQKKAHTAASAKIAAAEALVKDLERQLLAIEQSYYEENDLARRDGEIVRRFEDISRRLEEARKDLSALDGKARTP